MTVLKRRDNQPNLVVLHKIADVRGGVSVKSSELGGDFLFEGTVLSRPDEKGICHVVKVAEVLQKVEETGEVLFVKKGSHFKAGDFVLVAEGAKAAKITAVDKSDKTKDKITLDAAVGVVNAGESIAEAKEQSSDASVLKYVPFAVAGTGKPIRPNDNVDTDAWVLAVTKGNKLPDCVDKALKGVVNY